MIVSDLDRYAHEVNGFSFNSRNEPSCHVPSDTRCLACRMALWHFRTLAWNSDRCNRLTMKILPEPVLNGVVSRVEQ